MNLKISSRKKFGKKITKVLIFSFFLPFLFLLTSCKSEEILINNSLDISAEMGYDSTISLWAGNPVKFTITNAGADFSGEIKIILPVNYDEKHEIVIPVEVAAGSQKVIEKYLDIKTVAKEFDYELVSDGSTIKTGKIKVKKFIDPENNRIAVVADNPDKYSFLNSVGLMKFTDLWLEREMSYTEERAMEIGQDVEVKGVTIENFIIYLNNLENISDNQALMFFDFIFIGDSSELKLTDKGTENLINWLKMGGILIIENGKNFEKVNANLPDQLKQVDFTKVEEVSIEREGKKTDIKLASGQVLRDSVNPVNLHNYNKVLAYEESIGKGKLITSCTSLSTQEMQQDYQNASLLTSILSAAKANSKLTEDTCHDTDTYYEYVVDNIPNDVEFPYDLIAIILTAYVIIAAPLLYFILKKLDKHNLMWIIAPAMAILVIFIISQIGNFVWGNKPILNEASLITYEQNSDILTVKSRLGLFNNQKSDMKITWDSKQKLELDLAKYYDYNNTQFNGERRLTSSMYLTEEPVFYSYNTRLWDNMHAYASKSIQVNDEGTKVSLNSDGKKLLLKVKNGLPMDFKNTIVYYNSQFYIFGAIKSGEEVEKDLAQLKGVYETYDLNMYQSNFDNNSDYESIDLIDNITNRNAAFHEVSIFGLNSDPIGYDLAINDKEPKVFARNLIHVKANLDLAKDSHIMLSQNDVEAKTYSTQTDRENPTAIETDLNELEFQGDFRYSSAEMLGGRDIVNSTVSEFKIPDNISVNSVEIDFNNNDDDTIYKYDLEMTTLEDKHYIYNFKDDKYEELSFIKEASFSKEPGEAYIQPKLYKIDINKHLSEQNTIKIKVLKPEILDNKFYRIIPHKISVEGVYND